MLLFAEKRRIILTIKLYAITCSKIICKQKKFYQNFGYGAFVTMNFTINEVDKSGIIRINKRFKERKTKSTLAKDLLPERAF